MEEVEPVAEAFQFVHERRLQGEAAGGKEPFFGGEQALGRERAADGFDAGEVVNHERR